MVRRFAKVSVEKIVTINETAFFYPSALIISKTTIPLRVGEERWIYASTLRVSVYIHRYSPPFRGIVVYYQEMQTKGWRGVSGIPHRYYDKSNAVDGKEAGKK